MSAAGANATACHGGPEAQWTCDSQVERHWQCDSTVERNPVEFAALIATLQNPHRLADYCAQPLRWRPLLSAQRGLQHPLTT
jgi:hypothetical protein